MIYLFSLIPPTYFYITLFILNILLFILFNLLFGHYISQN